MNNPEMFQGMAVSATQSDDQFQAQMLQGVSRTFALTIPQLPAALCGAVSTGYLLCRIVDTIEDEPALTWEQKRAFCSRFVGVTAGQAESADFSRELAPLLSASTIPAEHELIREIPRVIRITHSYRETQQQALLSCVTTMAQGMPEFQKHNPRAGLSSLADMNRYCYFVAGCVGEMLTRLFCDYSSDIAKHRGELMTLSVSFGQGLQMTNILKDIWDDYERGVCWLPQEIFQQAGFNLENLNPNQRDERFQKGLSYLISIAFHHLENALRYTLLIPQEEKGIRRFCLWALGMAVLTLQKIKHNLSFSDSGEVKISRRSVKGTILATNLTGSHDTLLRMLFQWVGKGLAYPSWQPTPNTVSFE